LFLRPATQADQKTIEQIIHAANINPMSLDWHRFIVAEDDGRIVGIGQIKPHGDSSRELASIAVIPERQGQGIGGEITRTLVASANGPLYLTCRQPLETYYTRFGFRRIDPDEMTPYFRRIVSLANALMSVSGRGGRIIVMKRDGDRP